MESYADIFLFCFVVFKAFLLFLHMKNNFSKFLRDQGTAVELAFKFGMEKIDKFEQLRKTL